MIIWYLIHPWLSGNQNESGLLLVPTVTFELLGNPEWHQILIGPPRAMNTEQTSFANFVDGFSRQSNLPTKSLLSALARTNLLVRTDESI